MADGWLSAAKAHVITRAIDTLPGDPRPALPGCR